MTVVHEISRSGTGIPRWQPMLTCHHGSQWSCHTDTFSAIIVAANAVTIIQSIQYMQSFEQQCKFRGFQGRLIAKILICWHTGIAQQAL